ncbi:MAG: hypothetical protein KG012_14605 [Deltaproteobacteria bacterium]|jgi:hypothetical protein|nr:hypothetical protein [Deltaproteobacteria bacterium]
MISRKRLSSIFRIVFLLSILLILTACEHSPEIGPEPLAGFFERVTALVTTTVRGQLRDNPPKQQLLTAQLSSLEKTATMNQLTEELKGIDSLKDLAYLIEMDIMFELQKPENQRERIGFNSPEIQRQVVSAIIAGMKKALAQLKGGKDGK